LDILRGDARPDGVVDISDVLFIAQYLAGVRAACTATIDNTCLHLVNAASVRQEGAFDRTTIADAMFTAQHLVGSRDEFYMLMPQAIPNPQCKQYAQPPTMTIDTEKTYTATLFTNKGELVVELFAAEAPQTVNNFVFLAREEFYDGLTFHRVIRDFMVQGGDCKGDATGGPGYLFADEPVTRAYTRGILAMANRGPNTNGSQFFIVHAEDAGLAPSFTIFGEVTSGFETLDAIAATPVGVSPIGELSVPLVPIIIDRMEIEEASR
jgi:cyclophilin family peptidyl-prolyl cis-trans isomerase